MLIKKFFYTILGVYLLNVVLFFFLFSSAETKPTSAFNADHDVMKRIDEGSIGVRELLDYLGNDDSHDKHYTTQFEPNSKVQRQLEKRSIAALVKQSTKSENKFMQLLTANRERGMAYFKKVKERYMPKIMGAKEKVMQSVERTKAVYTRVRSNKWVNFTVTATSAVWKKLPKETRESIMENAKSFAIGKAGDILAGVQKVGFNPNELISDAEISSIMESDDDGENDSIEANLFGAIGASRGTKSSNCCCHLDRPKKGEKDLKVVYEDFDPKSLEEEEETDDSGIVNIDPYKGKQEFIDEAEQFQPRHPVHPVVKREIRSQCGCARDKDRRNLVDRELKRQEKLLHQQRQRRSTDENKKDPENYDDDKTKTADSNAKQPSEELPPVLMGLTHVAALDILQKAGINEFGKVCDDLNNPTPSCLSFEGVRIGALADLITLRLLCPICQIKVLSAVGSYPSERLLDGWNFILEDTTTLGAYITSALNTYAGHESYYDKGKNQYTLICKEDDVLNSECVWNLFTHL